MITTDTAFLVYLFIGGACIGSFLNVCIHRIPRHISIVFPGSSCPACKARIPFYHNLPLISFILLRGRCHSCAAPISVRYPLVEAITGLIAVSLALRFGFTPETLVWFVFACTLVVISFIDIDFQIIPDMISLPGIAVFGLMSWAFLGESPLHIASGILAGGGLLYGVAVVYYAVRKIHGMGGGDIKLLAMIGAITGMEGVFFTIFTASAIGTAIGGIMLISSFRQNGLSFRIPFGPFLSLGAFLYVLWGGRIISWYVSTLAGA